MGRERRQRKIHYLGALFGKRRTLLAFLYRLDLLSWLTQAIRVTQHYELY
jgi:hypothetical protein